MLAINTTSKKRLLYIIFTSIITTLLSGCHQAESTQQKDVILEIGNLRLTRYEWNKQLTQFTSEYEKKYHSAVPADSIKKKANDFVDYAYVLAGAYEKGYEENPSVKEKVSSTSKYIMCQKNGFFQKKVIAPKVHISLRDIDNAVIRSRQVISFALLRFRSKEDMVKLLGKDTALSDITLFKKYAEKSRSRQEIEWIQSDMTFPSEQLLMLQDTLWSMEDGAIAGPIYTCDDSYNAYFNIIYKVKTEPVSHNNRPPDRGKLKDVLQSLSERKLFIAYTHAIYQRSGFRPYDSVLHLFASNIKSDHKLLLDKNSVRNILDEKLFSYNLNHKLIIYRVSDFIDYFNHLSIRPQITTQEHYKNFCKEIALNDLMYHEADELGLTQDQEFAADQQNYYNKTVANFFQSDQLFSGITIPDTSLLREYKKYKPLFTTPLYAQVSVFTFNSLKEASDATLLLHSLPSKINPNKSLIDRFASAGIRSYDLHQALPYTSQQYDPAIIKRLFLMPDNSFSPPYFINNHVLVFRKEKNMGQRDQPFEEVKEKIREVMTGRQHAQIMQEYLSSAKKKYPLKNYFNEDDFRVKTIDPNLLRKQVN